MDHTMMIQVSVDLHMQAPGHMQVGESERVAGASAPFGILRRSGEVSQGLWWSRMCAGGGIG